MKFRIALPVLALAAAMSLPMAAADPTMLKAVMPDAEFVAGADIAKVMNSPFGQFALSKIGAEDKKLQAMIELTGFDPRRDLSEVLIASKNITGKGNAVVMVRGTFDLAKLTAAASLHGAALNSYNGVTMFSLDPKKPTEGVVALLPGLAIGGPDEDVKSTVDRFQSGKGTPPAITVQANAASAKYDAWAVSNGSPAQFAGRVTNPNISGSLKGDVLQGITQTSGGVRFGANVEIGGEAVMRSEQDAAALVDVYKFLMSMAQMNAPKAGPAASSPIQSLLGSATVTTSGVTVKFTAQLPQAELEKLLLNGRHITAQVRQRQ
ncbi:MAG: hypothetical protein ABI972_19215 [Acidobacteriota bacterium]